MTITYVRDINLEIGFSKADNFKNGRVYILQYRRFINGDEAALKEIYDEHSPLIMGLSRKLVGPEAEDLVQVVFLSAWSGRENFDPQKGSMKSWLCGITRFRAIDILRKKSRQPFSPVDNVESTTQTFNSLEVDLLVDSLVVHEALDELPEEKQRILKLGFIDQFSHSEIALKTGLPLGTVKSHIRRGLELLQKELGVSHVGI